MSKRSAVFAALSVSAVLTVTGCGASPSAPAADEEGMATFSCGLAAGFDDGTLSMTSAPEDADAGNLPLPFAAAALVGGSAGGALAGYEELFEPSVGVVHAVMAGDATEIEGSVQELLAACEASDIDFSGVDVSLEARTDYACSLAEHINTSEETPDEWMLPGLEDSYLFAAAHAVAGFLLEPEAVDDENPDEEFADATALMSALQRIDRELAVSSIESIAERCA